ncbi:hypothetical protein QTG56_24050 (plasmid) [Rossellomorea sp. AcN35-11]|nr:hypothetical protein [Rossellomorea aquimaris]WJV31712.1 hypothetical protein QTG56_24050 [Rossellomorea sp. AcN35-11]
MKRWSTLLELKEDHKSLGVKGQIFFIVDFPRSLESGELLFMIAQPTFTGLGVSPGILSFVLKKEQVIDLFSIMDQTFQQYAKELEEDYFHSD